MSSTPQIDGCKNGAVACAQNPKPYEVLTDCLSFENGDQDHWWRTKFLTISKMLTFAAYDVHLQYKYLLFCYKHLLPFLGPHPEKVVECQWKAIVGRGLTCAYSLNFQKDEAVVRIEFEPTNYLSGSERDPLNTLTIRDFFTNLERLNLGVDLFWWHSLSRKFLPSSEETATFLKSKSAESEIRTQVFVGIDLKDGGFMAKGYFCPGLKSLITGVTDRRLVCDALKEMEQEAQISDSLALLDLYISTLPETIKIQLVACDLGDPRKSRFKVYLTDWQVDLARIHDIWTLGGKVNDQATASGFEMLKVLWELLGLSEGTRQMFQDWSDKPLEKVSQQPLMFNLELFPNRPIPERKIYFPVMDKIDGEVADKLTTFFSHVGWTNLAQSYKSNLSSCFPDQVMSQSTEIHAWVSFTYTLKNGPYVSVYY